MFREPIPFSPPIDYETFQRRIVPDFQGQWVVAAVQEGASDGPFASLESIRDKLAGDSSGSPSRGHPIKDA